jgi:hypothetical protein
MEYTMASGSKLNVTMSSFQEANALKNALLVAVKGVPGLDDSLLAGTAKDQEIGPILAILVNAATSEEVERHLFKCFERCTYDNIRVTRDLFDDAKIGLQARQDYYEMSVKVIQENCLPFFKQALSLFAQLRTKADKSLA